MSIVSRPLLPTEPSSHARLLDAAVVARALTNARIREGRDEVSIYLGSFGACILSN